MKLKFPDEFLKDGLSQWILEVYPDSVRLEFLSIRIGPGQGL